MNNYKILLKLLLSNNFAFDKSKKKKKQMIAFVILGTLGFIPLIGYLCYSMYNMGIMSAQLDIGSSVLTMIYSTSQMLIIMFGLQAIMSNLFMSKDTEMLSALPIKNNVVFWAKMSLIYITESMLNFAISIPMVVAFTIGTLQAGVSLNAGYYIFNIIAILVVPLIPILFMTLIAGPIVRIIRKVKNKDIISLVLNSTVTVGFLVIYFVFMGKMGSTGTMDEIMQSLVLYFDKFAQFFFVNNWLTNMAFGIDVWQNILYFVSFNTVAVLLLIWYSKAMYFKSASGQFENSVNSKKETMGNKSNSIMLALIKRDMISLLGRPNFAMQSFMLIIFAPMMTVMGGAMGGSVGGIESLGMQLYMVIMMLGMNYTANIGITREGSSFHIMKSLPVSAKQVLKAKNIMSDAVTIIAMIFATIALIFMVSMPWWAYLLFLIILSAYGIVINRYALLRDVKNPNLTWLNEKAAVKKNFSAIVPMFISMGLGMLVMFYTMATSNLIKTWGNNIYLLSIFGVVLAITVVFGSVTYVLWKKQAYSAYEKI